MSFSILQSSATRLDCSRARDAHYGFDFTRLMAGSDRAPRIEALQASFAAARLFAQATDFTAAQSRLPHCVGSWPPAPKRSLARVLVIAHGSLSTLALIAAARIADWNLVIEDGDFTETYVVPLYAKVPGGVEFVPPAKLPSVWQKHRNSENGLATIWLTFCDRPVHAGGCSLTVDLSRGKYHLSVIDALLMASGFDEVFVLGRDLQQIAVQQTLRDGASRVSGETLMQYARQAVSGLLELVECAPEQYLGMVSLVTRSERYRMLARNNKRALVRSLLQYCQTNGLPLPVDIYHDFLRRTEALTF
jgi:hypothetical protein